MKKLAFLCLLLAASATLAGCEACFYEHFSGPDCQWSLRAPHPSPSSSPDRADADFPTA